MTLPSNHPDYNRANRYRRLFNITIEEYDLVLAYQKYSCFICQKPETHFKLRLAVDHNHKTALVRGLLCWPCNSLLTKAGDNPDKLERAAEYLRNPPFTVVLGEPRFGRKGRVTTKSRKKKRTTKKRTTRGKK